MMRGKVVKGDGVGRQLGYPTANLDTPKKDVSLKAGIYAAQAHCRGKALPAALVVQTEPWKVEVHLLEYDGQNCYGAVIDVEPVQKVSELEHFDSWDELKVKIATDIELVKRVLHIDSTDKK